LVPISANWALISQNVDPKRKVVESSTWSQNVPLLKTNTFDQGVKNSYSLRLGVIRLISSPARDIAWKRIKND